MNIERENIDFDPGWLVIPPQECVALVVNLTTLEERIKHWSRLPMRFYLCVGQGCDFCMKGVAKRQRYQVRVSLDGNWYWWEFGKAVYKLIKSQAGNNELVRLMVSRICDGRRTRYCIRRVSEDLQFPEVDWHAVARYANELRR